MSLQNKKRDMREPGFIVSGRLSVHDAEATTDVFLHALLAANRVEAMRIASSAVKRGASVADIHAHVIQPSMVSIGSLWAAGQISVAAEHTATAIVQFVVSSLYPAMQRSIEHRGRAVVAGVAGELHQLGAHMVSDALEADGWQVRFLGADCPCEEILSACELPLPDLLALSCTRPANLQEVRQVIQALRDQCAGGTVPRTLVGGQAFGTGLEAHQLASRLGADALAADLSGAVVSARALSERDDSASTPARHHHAT